MGETAGHFTRLAARTEIGKNRNSAHFIIPLLAKKFFIVNKLNYLYDNTK
jgi:hypothetical protein